MPGDTRTTMTHHPLEPGDTAPDFTLPDQYGNDLGLASLRGQRVIVYFYPEADTPACTTQACDFRDNLSSLTTAGFAVLGISKDPVDDLAAFAVNHGLTFPLLSDESLATHKAYNTWGEKQNYGRTYIGTIRSTFVIDEFGVLSHVFYNVKATGHVEMLRKRLHF
jgi:thioredoxin-dependent peroxiredoxin